MKTDYAETLTRKSHGRETVYSYELLDATQRSVLSTTFRCVPGEGKTRVIEECGGERFIHASCPDRKADSVVRNITRRYSVAYFLGILENRRSDRDAG